MGCSIYRYYEKYNKKTGKWEMIKFISRASFRKYEDDEDKKYTIDGETYQEQSYTYSDIGWDTEFLGGDNTEMYERGIPDDISDELKAILDEETKDKDGPYRYNAISYFDEKEVIDLYNERYKQSVQDLSTALASEAYSFFNSKLDKLLLWAAKDKKPKITKREVKAIEQGWDENGWSNMHVEDMLDNLRPLKNEICRFHNIEELIGDKYCPAEEIRVIFMYHF